MKEGLLRGRQRGMGKERNIGREEGREPQGGSTSKERREQEQNRTNEEVV